MSYEQYVVPIIAVAVYLLCMVAHSADFIPNKYLPVIAGLLGVGLNVWYRMGFNFEIFLGGLASGLAAVGVDQVVKVFRESA